MLKTYLYVPEELDNKVESIAKSKKISKAQALRDAIKEGVSALEKKQYGGAEVLLELAELARKNKIKGPRDGAVNHDYYLWGLPKRDTKIKP